MTRLLALLRAGPRTGSIHRKTRETEVSLTLDLDERVGHRSGQCAREGGARLDVAPTNRGTPSALTGRVLGRSHFKVGASHVGYLNYNLNTDAGHLYVAKLSGGTPTLLGTSARHFAFVGDETTPPAERKRFAFVGNGLTTGKTGMHEVVLP